jgi:PadR family transcriptional regulator PadR
LLDAAVLSVVARGDTYGYALTAQIRERVGVAESTIYPVLRRLEKEGSLRCYDVPTDGRNRRYYTCTDTGRTKLAALTGQWDGFKTMIDSLFHEELA